MTLIEVPARPRVDTLPDHRPTAVDRLRRPDPGPTDPLPLHPASTLPGAGTGGVDQTNLDRRLRGHLTGLAAAIVDAVAGRRPPQQLTRWVEDRVLAELVLRSRLVRLRGRAGVIRSVRLQRLEDRIEAAVRFGEAGHNEALALRFDRRGTRWVCTAADFGPGGEGWLAGTAAGAQSRRV